MTHTISRRVALTGAVASAAMVGATVAVAAPIVVAASGTNPRHAEWDRLCATFRATHAVEVKAQAVHDERHDQWIAGRATRTPKPVRPDVGPVDTSLPLTQIIAQMATPDWAARRNAYEEACATWQAQEDAACAAFMGDTEARYDEAASAATDAFMLVRDYPVTSLAMLNEKSALMRLRYGTMLEASEAEVLIRDIAALAGEVSA